MFWSKVCQGQWPGGGAASFTALGMIPIEKEDVTKRVRTDSSAYTIIILREYV